MLACCLSYPFHVCSSTPPLPCSSCAGHHTLLEVFPAAFPALVTLFNDLACFVLLHVLRHRADGGRLVEDIGRQRFDLQRFSERPIKSIPTSELPPSSKKLSSMPISATPSSSIQTLAMHRSRSFLGAAYSLARAGRGWSSRVSWLLRVFCNIVAAVYERLSSTSARKSCVETITCGKRRDSTRRNASVPRSKSMPKRLRFSRKNACASGS